MAALGLCGLLSLSACAPVPPPEQSREAPSLPLRSAGDAVHYKVAADGTEVYARVFRGGKLARLGHNHVVLFQDVRGDVFLADELHDSLFDLLVPVAGAEVDPPALRQRQGNDFDSDISDNAREGTRANMLGEKQLDAAAYPYVQVSSASISGSLPEPDVTMDVTIRGQRRRVTVPVSLEIDRERLRASGRFEVLQSEFGMEPFSTLGGALKVKDRIEVVFTIEARRVD